LFGAITVNAGPYQKSTGVSKTPVETLAIQGIDKNLAKKARKLSAPRKWRLATGQARATCHQRLRRDADLNTFVKASVSQGIREQRAAVLNRIMVKVL
jgi:hypothetical protein